MMREPGFKEWGKFRVQRTTMRISASVELEEWHRFQQFASNNGLTLAGLLRAGARKILEEAKVGQPKPNKQWVPDPGKNYAD